jgi:hypothetical protein
MVATTQWHPEEGQAAVRTDIYKMSPLLQQGLACTWVAGTAQLLTYLAR